MVPVPVVLWLFLEAIVISGVALGLAYVFFPKAVMGFLGKFFPRLRLKNLKRRVRIAEAELTENRRLGRKSLRGNKRYKLTKFQKFLRRIPFIKKFVNKPLNLRQKRLRTARIQTFMPIINKYDPDYTSLHYNSMNKDKMENEAKRRQAEAKSSKSYISEKQFAKGDKFVKATVNQSIKTSGEKTKLQFLMLSRNTNYQRSNSNNKEYDSMYIYTKNYTKSPAEYIASKDKYSFYRVGATMLNEILENVDKSVFPIKIDKTTIDENGKESSRSLQCIREDVERLMKHYDEEAKKLSQQILRIMISQKQTTNNKTTNNKTIKTKHEKNGNQGIDFKKRGKPLFFMINLKLQSKSRFILT